jgi:hypothetical protein
MPFFVTLCMLPAGQACGSSISAFLNSSLTLCCGIEEVKGAVAISVTVAHSPHPWTTSSPGRCTVGSQGSSRGPGEVGAAAFAAGEEREEGEEPVAAAGGKDRVLCPSRRNPRVIGE